MHTHGLATLGAKIVDTWYHLSWTIVADRWLFVILIVLIGLVLANHPFQSSGPSRHKHFYLTRSLIGILAGLTISAALVATSALTHAADARWLPPAQRQGAQIPAPAVPSASNVPLVGNALGAVTRGINNGFKDMASGTNSALKPVLGLEVQAKAVRVAMHVVVQFSLISIASGMTLAALLATAYMRDRRKNRRRLDVAERRINALEVRLDALTGPDVSAAALRSRH